MSQSMWLQSSVSIRRVKVFVWFKGAGPEFQFHFAINFSAAAKLLLIARMQFICGECQVLFQVKCKPRCCCFQNPVFWNGGLRRGLARINQYYRNWINRGASTKQQEERRKGKKVTRYINRRNQCCNYYIYILHQVCKIWNCSIPNYQWRCRYYEQHKSINTTVDVVDRCIFNIDRALFIVGAYIDF